MNSLEESQLLIDSVDDEVGISQDRPRQSQNSEQNEIITDKFNLVRIFFFMIGLVQLLPINFLITADDFWMQKFRNLNNTNSESELQTYFASYLMISGNGPFLLIYLISFTKYYQSIDNHLKNCIGFIVIILGFLIISAFVIIDTDSFQFLFFELFLALVFILCSFAIIIQSNFTGIASLFPVRYMHSFVTGQAISGLFAAFAKLCSLFGSRSLIFSVFVFFIFADLIILFTFVMYLFVRNKPFYKFYTSRVTNLLVEELVNFSLFLKMLKLMWPFCLTLMFVFWITLSIYPGLFVLIQSDDQTTTIVPEKFILPLFCFLVFNLGDFLGRQFGGRFLLRKNQGLTSLGISISRVVFIPLFIFCNAQPRHLVVWFKSETYFIAFNLIFSLLNGYLVLNSFVNGPLLIPEQYRHFSGYLLVAFLGLGLTLGSLTSPLILRVL